MGYKAASKTFRGKRAEELIEKAIRRKPVFALGLEADGRRGVTPLGLALATRRRLPPPPPVARAASGETLWFTQRLDHFNTSNNDTWKQRFFRNTAHHEAGGPVLLYVGAETEANVAWVEAGFMASLCARLRGLCLELEHRFYGQSRPTRDLSKENLRFLSAEQALADLANFIRQYRQEHADTLLVPWVVFGGSYAGNLAAWARLRYPHLVDAAVASSAPVLANLTFPGYLEVVGEVIGANDAACLEDIRAAAAELEDRLRTEADSAIISKFFRLCTPLNASNTEDVASVEDVLEVPFANAVQSSSNKVGDGVRRLCAAARNSPGETALQRHAALAVADFGADARGSCLNATYVATIADLRRTNYSSSSSRQWLYQTCTEFGYFVTTDSDKQPFGHRIGVSFSGGICEAVFGPEFTLERTSHGVSATNTHFGGRSPNVSHVVFVNGALDPWHRLSVTHDLSDTARAVVIPDTSHCADMLDDGPGDSNALHTARRRIAELVATWTVAAIKHVHGKASSTRATTIHELLLQT
ncbi:thymus-specific serine protease-like [Schistocerca piceifrons]|uniref:thymus-specific serine protease-like n=1 Tax=Schistocerca piceifrons TaxID=274613 RepID=UPI001F5FD9FE|nr:thymus-specific serine protease-like [Schistocerca piceifrons]